MATATRTYVAASAVAVLLMVGRLGWTDRPSILHVAESAATVSAIMLAVVLLIALVLGLPTVILIALIEGLSALFGRKKRNRGAAPPPVLTGPPDGKEAT